jgi:hypothetical protein
VNQITNTPGGRRAVGAGAEGLGKIDATKSPPS